MLYEVAKGDRLFGLVGVTSDIIFFGLQFRTSPLGPVDGWFGRPIDPDRPTDPDGRSDGDKKPVRAYNKQPCRANIVDRDKWEHPFIMRQVEVEKLAICVSEY